MSFFKIIQSLLLFITLSLHADDQKIDHIKSAITYEFNGGRFGDNLHSFSLALWIAFHYSIPLLYKPFPYSDQLKLHQTEKLYNEHEIQNFTQVVYLDESKLQSIDPYAGILYVCSWQSKIKVNYQDEKFLALLKDLIAPIAPMQKIEIKDRIGVAIHIRTGGTFEDYKLETETLRFAPLSYYIDQVRVIYALLGKSLFLHLFSDDKDPERLAKLFQEKLHGLDIEIFYRKNDNAHNKNVVEDFFMMTQYQCLIRPNSHFSIWSQRLGNHKLITIPGHATLINNTWQIDKVTIINQFPSLS